MRCAAVFVAIVVISPRWNRAEDKPAARPGDRPPRSNTAPERRSPITVSTKTTRILQPLDGEGNVDYVGALNQMASVGVTPENNAGVLFVRALGLTGFDPTDRAIFFKQLQIDPLPEQGNYLTDFGDFVKRKLGRRPTEKEDADFQNSMQRPWTASDVPPVAEWLSSNKTPLDVVVEGTRRPKCYLPLVEHRELGLVAVLLPTLQGARTAARALTARAMLRIHEGKISEAENDLLACHRLARLVGSSTPLIIGEIYGIAVDAVAFAGDVRLIESADLSSADALAYQQALCKLTPFPLMADVIDTSERFMFLDSVVHLARTKKSGVEDLRRIGDGRPVVPKELIVGMHLSASLLDWDAVLQFGNEWFDKAVSAARERSALKRKQAVENFDRELLRLKAPDFDHSNPAPAERSPRQTIAREIGKTLTVILMPSVASALDAESRARARLELHQLGFGLSAYRADHGTYPNGLDVLPPKYIARVPQDPFTERPLIYKRQADGFMLYSVGPNGTDDGGVTQTSRASGDDIVLRVTHEPSKKP